MLNVETENMTFYLEMYFEILTLRHFVSENHYMCVYVCVCVCVHVRFGFFTYKVGILMLIPPTPQGNGKESTKNAI